MADSITDQIVVAYSQCPWKAFLLLRSEDHGTPHEYVRLQQEYTHSNKIKYQYQTISQDKPFRIHSGDDNILVVGENAPITTPLKFRDLETDSCVLSKIHQGSCLTTISYTPTIIVGTHKITNEQKLSLLFAGYVLGKMHKQPPLSGTIINTAGQSHKIGLESAEKTLSPIIDTLRGWIEEPPVKPPQLVLNKHCSLCQFKIGCLDQAEKNDNLSLLDRITIKKILQYKKKEYLQLPNFPIFSNRGEAAKKVLRPQ